MSESSLIRSGVDEENLLAVSEPSSSRFAGCVPAKLRTVWGELSSTKRALIGLAAFAVLVGAVIAIVLAINSAINGDLVFQHNVQDRVKNNGAGSVSEFPLNVVDTNQYSYMNPNLPPRLEWNENYGYCGETSFLEASLSLGHWASQYDIRALASNGTDQAKSSSQLLLGVNDWWAANDMKMTANLWKYSDTNIQDFMVWVKTNVLQGYVVIIGVFENSSVFGQSDPDSDYDHIIPVVGWSSNHPLTDLGYYSDDVIYYTDNGLYTPVKDPIYSFNNKLSDFQQSRSGANKPKSPVYSINGYPTRSDPNFAIAITGIQDPNQETVPVVVTPSTNNESPEVKDGSNYRPSAEQISLTVTVSGLTVGTSYNLYRYSAFSQVPTKSFNANAKQAAQLVQFTATDVTYQYSYPTSTSVISIFRAVPADGA